jgi:hypothetical protein
MKSFVLGILVTLAVLYPTVTKNILANTVDTTHSVVTNIINTSQGEDK